MNVLRKPKDAVFAHAKVIGLFLVSPFWALGYGVAQGLLSIYEGYANPVRQYRDGVRMFKDQAYRRRVRRAVARQS
jgi:hypothetical protein